MCARCVLKKYLIQISVQSTLTYHNHNMPYEVNIDFDEASDAWLQNKVKNAQCVYSYICGHITKRGTRCMHKPLKANDEIYCYIHSKQEGKPKRKKRKNRKKKKMKDQRVCSIVGKQIHAEENDPI